jgi:hypothetical protein
MECLVGAVGIELADIIPKPLCFQYLTDKHKITNPRQSETDSPLVGQDRRRILSIACYLALLAEFIPPLGFTSFTHRGFMRVFINRKQHWQKWTCLASKIPDWQLASTEALLVIR